MGSNPKELRSIKCRGVQNERKFLETSEWERGKLFAEEGIQQSDGGTGKKRTEPFDLQKKAAAMKQI